MSAEMSVRHGIIEVSEAARCGNTERPLAHLIDLTDRQDEMNATSTYRWMCHQGHFLAESALHSEDHLDNGAYYGVSTRVTATCKACGVIDNPRLVAINTREVKATRYTTIKTCTVESCEKNSFGNETLCPTHRARMKRTGRLDTRDPVRKFWERVNKDSGCACWLWTGTVITSGYGQLRALGKRVAAHRFSYELHKGPIPEGLTIDHVFAWGCRNRHCVNPDHLEAVTQAENNRRAHAATAARKAGIV